MNQTRINLPSINQAAGRDSQNRHNDNACQPNSRNRTDCQVLYVGNSHDTYRGVNETLTPLGLNVMWTRDIDSAQMLAQTTNMELLLCDSEINRSAHTLFDPNVIPPGASCLEMRFTACDLLRTKKLRSLVSNLITPSAKRHAPCSSDATRIMR